MVKIFIDPGHGGSDPGAVGNGLFEKNVTLSIASRIQQILLNEYEGVSTRMSRTSDQSISLQARTDAANAWGADFFLSIHVNAGGGTGFESYVYPNVGTPTTTYQRHIHDAVMSQVDFYDRGKKQANFHVLRETRMPALLTENGFIDNANDASKLKSSSFLDRLARGHVLGLERAFCLERKRNNDTNVQYKVQIGAFSKKENADNLSNKAEDKGFNTYVFLEDGLWKVQIGAFSSYDNARNLANQAEKEGFDVYIVPS